MREGSLTAGQTNRKKGKNKPLKRHPALVPLSKDHHFGLLLCWKIRTGIKKDIAADRISRYVTYFYKNHLKHHFDEEERHIFTRLDEKNVKRKKAERQHRKIRRLVKKLSTEPEKAEITLGQIEEELEIHVRFEERDLFPYLQNCLDDAVLEQLEGTIRIPEAAPDQWKDQFWKKNKQ